MFGLPVHSAYGMLFVFVLLSLSTLIYWGLRQSKPEKDYTELWLRIRSWWVMIALLFGVLWFSTQASIIFFGFLSFLALKEFFSIVPTRLSDRRVLFWAYLAIPIQYWWVADAWYGMFIVFIPVYIFLLIPIRMVLIGETSGFIRSAGTTHWAVMLTVFSISHIAYLLVLPVKNESAGGIGLVLFLVFLTQFNDVAQYVWGKLLGRHKVIPKVSPNKTWEGLLGGVATTTLFGLLLAPYLTPLDHPQGAAVGLLIGLAGFFGDVVISSVKRDLRIKDSGQLIPGHGGILDRMDSLMYSAPLFFHVIYYLKY
jgi:phosphatidate cytidylyltransferase